ncbi:MAG TPA: inositol monophosphatase family protein [Acidimicrobiales bacterium]
MSPGIDDDLDLALRLADAADEETMGFFTGDPVPHDIKPDGSPVSAADLAVERRLAALVEAQRPADGVLGEEVGALGPSGRRWIVDGIDGTVLFVAGRRGWATQIALEVDGEVVVGVTTGPADGHRYWAARGRGAWRRRVGPDGADDEVARIHVSDVTDLAGGRFTTIPPADALTPERLLVAGRLGEATAGYLPPREHGALLVADGRASICLQLGGGAWDFAALQVIVAEAGGRYSDVAGRRDIYGGGPVLFSNGRVHDAALAVLAADRA